MATRDLNVVVKLVDQMTRPVRGLTKTVDALTASVRRLNGSSTANVTKNLNNIVAAANRAKTALDNVAPKSGITVSTGPATKSLNALIATSKRTRTALSQISPAGGVHVDTKVAARNLGNLSRSFTSLRARMQTPIQITTRGGVLPGTTAHPAGIGGGSVANAATGYAVARGTGYAATQGGDMTRSNLNLELAGRTEEERARITAKATELSRAYPQFSIAPIQDAIGEIVSVYGDTDKALQGIETALQSAVVLSTKLPPGASQDEMLGQVFAMFKSADLRNVTDDPKATEVFFDNMTKVISATQGQVTPQDFLMFSKYGKSSTQYWSDEFITRIAASVMQEGSPSTVGTALAGMYQTLIAGRITTKGAGLLVDMGLVQNEDIIRNAAGDPKGIQPGGVVGSEQFKENPYDWIQKIFAPAMGDYLVREGTLQPGYTPDDLAQASADITAGIFSRNPAWITDTLGKTRPIERDRENINEAVGISGYEAIQQKDLFTAATAFTAQWNNLLASLTGPLIQPATDLLNMLALGMNSLAMAASANPDMAGTIGLLGIAAAGLVTLAAGVRTLTTALALAGIVTGGGGAIAAAGGLAGSIGRGLRGAVGLTALPALVELLENVPGPRGQPIGEIANMPDFGDMSKPWHQKGVEFLDPGLARMMYGAPVQGPPMPPPAVIAHQGGMDPIGEMPGADQLYQQMGIDPMAVFAKSMEVGQAVGNGTSQGMAASAPLVVGQASSMMAQIQAIMGVGVTVPVRMGPMPAVPAGVMANAQVRQASSRSSTTNVGGITVNAAPGQNPTQVAQAVETKFNQSTNRQLSDGAYA